MFKNLKLAFDVIEDKFEKYSDLDILEIARKTISKYKIENNDGQQKLVFYNDSVLDFGFINMDIDLIEGDYVVGHIKRQLKNFKHNKGEKIAIDFSEKITEMKIRVTECRRIGYNEYELADDEIYSVEDDEVYPVEDDEVYPVEEEEVYLMESEKTYFIEDEEDETEIEYIENGKIFQLGEIIWEDDNLKIIFAGIYRGNIKIYISNKTARKIEIGCYGLSINGFELNYNIFEEHILPRKKKICEVYDIDIDSLGMNSIYEVEYIELGLMYTKLKRNNYEKNLPWVKLKPLNCGDKMLSAFAFEDAIALARELNEHAIVAYHYGNYELTNQLLERAYCYSSDIDCSWMGILCIEEETCSDKQLAEVGYNWLIKYCNNFIDGKVSKRNFNLTGFYNLGVVTSKIMLLDGYDKEKLMTDLTKIWKFSSEYALKEKIYGIQDDDIKDLVIMGVCFYNGHIATEDSIIPIEQNYELASRIFAVGEEYDEPLAFAFKGIMYNNGTLVGKNLELAYRKYLYAALCGEINSQSFCQERYIKNLALEEYGNKDILIKDLIADYPKVLESFAELGCVNLHDYSEIEFSDEHFIYVMKSKCGEGHDEDAFIVELEEALSKIEKHASVE